MLLFRPTSSAAADPDLHAVLRELRSEVMTVVADRFIGLYLWGSLANGGFDAFSDIDFVVALDCDIPDDGLPGLRAMHTRLRALPSAWAAHLDGSYITTTTLRRYDADHPPHLYVDHGTTEPVRSHHDNTWLFRHVVRERGMTLAGPAPHLLIDPVDPDDLRREAVAMTRGWLGAYVTDSDPLNTFGLQTYSVLTLCRMLYTLHHGDVVSKPLAAAWAMRSLDRRWAPLIEHALQARPEGILRYRESADPEAVATTLDFIRDALEHMRDKPASDWSDRG
ncbi:MAG: DUF4111 domain-containing protein [Chloroflexi bacterium]|nr:DUF4111 domain-containing protein [Chloroflexota bacterium]